MLRTELAAGKRAPFERLDRHRRLANGLHQRAVGWLEVKPHNVRGLGGEGGIVAHAARCARRKIDLLRPQEA
jgi:hypothetical protein